MDKGTKSRASAIPVSLFMKRVCFASLDPKRLVKTPPDELRLINRQGFECGLLASRHPPAVFFSKGCVTMAQLRHVLQRKWDRWRTYRCRRTVLALRGFSFK